ncbi:3039_t:CDS:2 [Cetraspora pellucida]|uniref:3039_t:CDS:1 n=1 Tax=Cetraspora pellucida TaxID=1433469 RepID=A0ACA9K1I5_9GLOM|nr:3039_t:CDS:2 [Cetraspora pellucida]
MQQLDQPYKQVFSPLPNKISASVELQPTSNYPTQSNVIEELKLLKVENETLRRENT